MAAEIDVLEFVSLMGDRPVVDVRTSAEYERGHIPSALSLPLFSNEERAEVGTVYKKMGRVQATQVGLDLVGPRLKSMVNEFRRELPSGEVIVHCWRGGMRSQSVAWLLGLTGEFEPAVLRGGYKAYRRFALREFEAVRNLRILGGMTGTAKTDILAAILSRGGHGVDLEALASHRGSAFGAIGRPAEPTQQQFENDLALALHRSAGSGPCWIEDESRHIGRRIIPDALWAQMRSAPVIVIERSREERVQFLMQEYGSAPAEELARSVRKIEKRLGGERAATALHAIASGNIETAINVVLDYYDRTYSHGLSRRDPDSISRIDVTGRSPEHVAELLLRML